MHLMIRITTMMAAHFIYAPSNLPYFPDTHPVCP